MADLKTKILVVEDDPSVARVLGMALTAAGFDIAAATSGEEALRILTHDGVAPVKAVAMDLRIADGRGADVLQWLQLHEGQPEAPVWLVMSSLDRQEAVREFGPLGDNFVAKPFDPWKLVDLLKGLLHRAA